MVVLLSLRIWTFFKRICEKALFIRVLNKPYVFQNTLWITTNRNFILLSEEEHSCAVSDNFNFCFPPRKCPHVLIVVYDFDRQNNSFFLAAHLDFWQNMWRAQFRNLSLPAHSMLRFTGKFRTYVAGTISEENIGIWRLSVWRAQQASTTLFYIKIIIIQPYY